MMPTLWKEPRRAEVGATYRLFRALIRIGFALTFRKIRLLGAERVPDSGPVLFFVGAPARFSDTLVLVAAMEREVRCVIEPAVLGGPLSRLSAWGLRMIRASTYEGSDGVAAASGYLAAEGAVVTFAAPGPAGGLARAAAKIAVESQGADTSSLVILPVHLFLPASQWTRRERLVYVAEPIFAEDFSETAEALAAALSLAVRPNAFRLPPQGVEHLLSGLEQVLCNGLEALWAARPNWKQTTEGFTLSQWVKDWAEDANDSDPAQVLVLRESLDAYREARRLLSLRQFQMQAEEQLRSPWGRAAIWAESLVGLPLALYGGVNHLVAGVILLAAGLLKSAPSGASGRRMARAGILVACYAAQVALVAHSLGRAAAGYYLLTLPVSGAYLWRYYGLFQHRVRLLLGLAAPVGEVKLRHLHDRLMTKVDRAERAYVESTKRRRSDEA